MFATTPTETRQLLTDVGPGTAGDPPTVVPIFRYYSYLDGELDPTPLPTPLSAADAELTVQVNGHLLGRAEHDTPTDGPERRAHRLRLGTGALLARQRGPDQGERTMRLRRLREEHGFTMAPVMIATALISLAGGRRRGRRQQRPAA